MIATIGRLDKLQAKGDVETLLRSLSRFSDKVLLVLSERSQLHASAKKIGPSLICERLWQELGIKSVINDLVSHRNYKFDVERAIFLTVLHRLFISGSDRSCHRWHRDYRIDGVESIQLHHLYRAMAFLGEATGDNNQQDEAAFLSPRCIKDQIEECLFFNHRDLFSGLDFVFFDTTSIYFEGNGGISLGQKGFSKDHRPDLNQMVVGVVLDNCSNPLCCEMWPGNTADVTTLIPATDRIRQRFGVGQFCLLADRGLISSDNKKHLDEHGIAYIIGARMRRVTDIKTEVLSDSGDYQEIYPESLLSHAPSPLKVKEVIVNQQRYIVCLNEKQARKDAADRQRIVETLEAKLNTNPKALVGNKGYRQYLKLDRDHITIDEQNIEEDARYDGKWVLQTDTALPAAEVALKYKELWQVEHVFRDMKSVLDTRPIFHQRDETIRGHVFCSFLALLLRKELDRRLEQAGHNFEWAEIKQDLRALQEIIVEDNGKSLAIRSECLGVCGKIFQSIGVALPPTIREL